MADFMDDDDLNPDEVVAYLSLWSLADAITRESHSSSMNLPDVEFSLATRVRLLRAALGAQAQDTS